MANASKHKSNLVHAAVRLFRQNGYAATGLNEILAESGAPKGSLYHYFPGGKEELGAAAVTVAGKVVTATLRDLADRSDSVEGFVQAYCEMLSGWLEDSEFRSGCPIATTLLETTPDSEPIAQAGQLAFQHWVGAVAAVLERHGHAADSARERANVLIASVEGALLMARVQRSTKPIECVATVFQRRHFTSPAFV